MNTGRAAPDGTKEPEKRLEPENKLTRTFRLSKSKIMAGLQCHKRLWLQTHRPELCKVSEESEHIFRMGHLFGDLARSLMGQGELIGHERDIARALDETPAALARAQLQGTLVFEPAFAHYEVCARADGFEPYGDGWHMREVKAATSDKDYFYVDCAVQVWVAEGAGYPVRQVSLGIVNNRFVYPGSGLYDGLLRELDATEPVARLKPSIGRIVVQLQAMLAGDEPDIRTGEHCTNPYECPFIEHCRSQEPPQLEYPVEIFHFATARRLRRAGYTDALTVPVAEVKQPRDLRILHATRTGIPFLDKEFMQELVALPYPRHFLDFETLQSSVPLWAGTRPFQQIPFQWSCHTETAPGVFTHEEFLDVSGELPVRAFAETLLRVLGTHGAVLVYSAFERTQLKGLYELLPHLRPALSALVPRLVDLLPYARLGYYHPEMKGSWSIKQVLPTVCPDLGYSDLQEVADGRAAQRAWWEASDPATPETRRDELRNKMLRYCHRDTLAMVAVYRAFTLARQVSAAELGETTGAIAQ
ncbi:hypothetical protein P3T23_000989 [Paraburkholderia sp. GAS448]